MPSVVRIHPFAFPAFTSFSTMCQCTQNEVPDGRRRMKLIKNTGNDRVMDALRSSLTAASSVDIATPAFSLFAFAEFATHLHALTGCRLVLPDVPTDLQLLGSEADRPFRNQLT